MTKPKKGKRVSDEYLENKFSKLEKRVNEGSLFKRKVRLRHCPSPALSDLMDEGRWRVLYRSKYREESNIIPSSTIIMYNPYLSAYLYYSATDPPHIEKNPCYLELPKNHSLTAKPFCPIIYAPTEKNLEEAERELKKHDWVFF